MSPDLLRAATLAAQILIEYDVSTAPVIPIPILKSIPNVIVLSYAEMALNTGLDRSHLLRSFSDENYDAMTFAKEIQGILKYFVIYNQRLPIYMAQRALARELGHIVLGHDGSRPVEVRMAEAQTFAYHLICPRAIIQAVRESGLRLTTEVLGNMTGCYERCLAGMRKTPGVRVAAALNRQIRDRFSDYISSYLEYQSIVSASDDSAIADFGTYMDLYED